MAPCRLLSGRPGKAGPFGTVHARQQKEGREARPRKRRQQGRDRKVRAPAAAIQLQRCCIEGKKPRVPARKSIRPGTLDRLPADRPKVSSSQPTEEGEDEASSVGKRSPGWRARRRFFRVERRRHFARVVAWLGELAGNAHRRVDTRRDYRDHSSHAERPREVDNADATRCQLREAAGRDCNSYFRMSEEKRASLSAIARRYAG